MEIKDMSFSQYLDWATGYILMGIGRGETLRGLLHSVLLAGMNCDKITWKEQPARRRD